MSRIITPGTCSTPIHLVFGRLTVQASTIATGHYTHVITDVLFIMRQYAPLQGIPNSECLQHQAFILAFTARFARRPNPAKRQRRIRPTFQYPLPKEGTCKSDFSQSAPLAVAAGPKGKASTGGYHERGRRPPC